MSAISDSLRDSDLAVPWNLGAIQFTPSEMSLSENSWVRLTLLVPLVRMRNLAMSETMSTGGSPSLSSQAHDGCASSAVLRGQRHPAMTRDCDSGRRPLQN